MMQIGDRVASYYQLVDFIKTTWLVKDIRNGVLGLLKPADCFIDPQIPAWLNKIRHPGLPRCLVQNIDLENVIYNLFEYLPGKSLDILANEHHGILAADILLPAMTAYAGILGFLHRQDDWTVLHLDIKPCNLILNEQGQAGLIDFGAAMLCNDRQAAIPDIASGQPKIGSGGDNPLCQSDGLSLNRRALTPDYAAPELLAGRPCSGSDIYALGLTMLVLLTGFPPAECRSRPLPELMSDIDHDLSRILGRCLHTDLQLRYTQAEELAYDLNAVWHRTPAARVSKTENSEKNEKPLHENALPPVELSGPQKQPEDAAEGPVPAVSAPKIRISSAPFMTIWDGPECGCELAGVLAADQDVIVIDANLLNPRADMLLGAQESSSGLFTQPTGLDMFLSGMENDCISCELIDHLAEKTQVRRVRLLTIRSNLNSYESYQTERLYEVIKIARLICDFVIILCNRLIFDAFTCLCLLAADHILVPLAGNAGSFREINRMVDFMVGQYKLKSDRLHYVAFPYCAQTDLSWGTMDELCCGRLAGCISDRKKRLSMKCGAVPYAAELDRINQCEYHALIRRLLLPEHVKEEKQPCRLSHLIHVLQKN
ncbi:MAG: hypothetical protein VB070_04945 [Clostridiaceae bacterium]|nr:hypothetical protein [Clostridiaceae bacterium]